METFESDLDYEFTTPVYTEEVNKTVYLDFIEQSNMDYFTTVEKKKSIFIPLLFYNLSKGKFRITLGEKSLVQPYREFLTDALLAECSRSTCFNLEDATSEDTDKEYILTIKILNNKTTSIIEKDESFVFIPSEEEIELELGTHKVKDIYTDLSVSARLSKKDKILVEKVFTTNYELIQSKKYPNVSEECLGNMSESLSLATKKTVEDITSFLHLIMLNESSNK
ncbi:MAG: hypothetical protein LIO93_10790 [Bacteroidales bacterium]|nr:hypothetical protein [Bacteroidales bacterium]